MACSQAVGALELRVASLCRFLPSDKVECPVRTCVQARVEVGHKRQQRVIWDGSELTSWGEVAKYVPGCFPCQDRLALAALVSTITEEEGSCVSSSNWIPSSLTDTWVM